MWIRRNHKRKVAVCFMPQQEGPCQYQAVLELTFCDHERKADFIIKRTLSGQAKETGVPSRQGLLQIEHAPNTASQPMNDRVDDDARILVDEESFDCSGTGISVSHADGLDFGIVDRKRPNGPFATPSYLLTIKHEDDFPDVRFVEGRTKGRSRGGSWLLIVLYYSPRFPSFRAVVEGDAPIIRPGTVDRVRVIFSPKYEGLFKATLELIFYHTQLLVYFVVRRALQGIAGSLDDHKHFESLGQEGDLRTIKSQEASPGPRGTMLLLSPDQRRRSRYFPNYELPPIVQEALARSTVTHPYDEDAPGLISALRPDSLNMNTYAHYFNALLAIEDGHQQYVPYLFFLNWYRYLGRWDVMYQHTYEVNVQGCGGHRYR